MGLFDLPAPVFSWLDQALAWEEQQAIVSAQKAMASMIAGRKDEVIARGRQEKDEAGD